MKKLIYGKLQNVTLIEECVANGIAYEIVMYLYKGKEPVYYSFFKGSLHKGLIIGTAVTSVKTLSDFILYNRYPFAYKIVNGYFDMRPKFNYTKLKLLKILR